MNMLLNNNISYYEKVHIINYMNKLIDKKFHFTVFSILFSVNLIGEN